MLKSQTCVDLSMLKFCVDLSLNLSMLKSQTETTQNRQGIAQYEQFLRLKRFGLADKS